MGIFNTLLTLKVGIGVHPSPTSSPSVHPHSFVENVVNNKIVKTTAIFKQNEKRTKQQHEWDSYDAIVLPLHQIFVMDGYGRQLADFLKPTYMFQLDFDHVKKEDMVIEKEPIELNSDAAVDPTDTFED